MAPRRTFSHILFDLDRTLAYYRLSTADIVTKVFADLRIALEPFGSADDVAASYDGWWVALERTISSVEELRHAAWRRVVEERGAAPDLVEPIASHYSALRSANGVELYEGARDLLRDLRARGIGLGLLTNGGVSQWEKIDSLGIASCFDAIAVAGDLDLYKPDRRAFDALLGRLDAAAAASLFVGDSYEADIVGADSAGLATAWIRPAGTPTPGAVRPTYEWTSVLGVREVAL